jgi:hypothetical protein
LGPLTFAVRGEAGALSSDKKSWTSTILPE